MPKTKPKKASVNKRVRITLEISQSFLRLLIAKVNLAYLEDGQPRGDLDPAGVLAVLACAEARGMTELQIHMALPPMWRGEIDVIHAMRQVFQDDVLIAGPTIEIGEEVRCSSRNSEEA